MPKKTFILHDETVNTQGFRMLTSGADLSVFKNNPVMLLNHDDWDPPIGRWENIRVEGTQILADAVFDEDDERAVAVMGKVERGFLKAASIGGWPGKSSDDPSLMLPGQTYPTMVTWTAREASICTIGEQPQRTGSVRQGEQADGPERQRHIDQTVRYRFRYPCIT